MDSSASSTDNSRSISQNNPVNVTIQGSSDPQAAARQVRGAIVEASQMSLRNAQSAIR